MTSGSAELWITYAWTDDEEGDFSFLVQELAQVGVRVTYDKVALVPGRRLWEEIADRITTGPYDGWAYLLTPNSMESEACREELAYALDRALKLKGSDFPLIGLLHGVPIDEVPPALRVRLCVSLASPDWKEEIVAGLEGRPPQRVAERVSNFVFRIYRNYQGDPAAVAVEIRPRFAQVMNWRIAIPSAAKPPLSWGFGPAGGGPLSMVMSGIIEGSTAIDGGDVAFFGAGDPLSPSVSAYAIFEGELPSKVFFGVAERDLIPAVWEYTALGG